MSGIFLCEWTVDVSRTITRAILLDVDGTLYHQSPLRLCMALELSTLPLAWKSRRSATVILNTLRHFRSIRETLRNEGRGKDLLVDLQYKRTAEHVGLAQSVVEDVVREWMYQRPLKYLRFCKRLGLEAFFSYAEMMGLRIGVFSDYPAQEKLQSLGLAKRVHLSLCATDMAINAFKPHPQGYWQACEHWGLKPEEVLYVGDRPEVDANGAAAAGMPCAILSRLRKNSNDEDLDQGYSRITSFRDLQHVLANKRTV